MHVEHLQDLFLVFTCPTVRPEARQCAVWRRGGDHSLSSKSGGRPWREQKYPQTFISRGQDGQAWAYLASLGCHKLHLWSAVLSRAPMDGCDSSVGGFAAHLTTVWRSLGYKTAAWELLPGVPACSTLCHIARIPLFKEMTKGQFHLPL